MATGKTKLVLILALLLSAFGFQSIQASAADAPSQGQDTDSSITKQAEQVASRGDDLQSETGFSNRQPLTSGGRELFYKMLMSVSLVIVFGIVAVYVSRKLLPRIANLPGKKIRVIETAYIAPRKGLHLIQIGDKRLLIASTNDTITMLADVTDSGVDFQSQLEARSKTSEW